MKLGRGASSARSSGGEPVDVVSTDASSRAARSSWSKTTIAFGVSLTEIVGPAGSDS